MTPHVSIVIPSYNRAHLIRKAVDAALGQSYHNCTVTVVDDGSADATQAALTPYFDDPSFNYIRLARNMGTAAAKNAGILLAGGEAVTFHDSDDLPHRDKVLHQVRILANPTIRADDCLNWRMVDRVPGSRVQVGLVLTHHELILPDGRREEIRRTLSILDDVFPNLQMGAYVPGDWTHINSGLFHAGVFERLGGFADCIEEDRELRNRIVLSGEVVWVVPEILLTKIETPDSLTQSEVSDYHSARRKADRQLVWARVEEWRRTGRVAPEPIALDDLEVAFVSNPALLAAGAAAATPGTRAAVRRILARHGAPVLRAEAV